ncbi:MAG: amino acid adenylation domain-containing protein [Acidimicrobiales bacterium]
MSERRLLSDLVARSAQDRPAAIAATCDGDELSWAELDRRVGQLSAALLDGGVQRGERVGIYLHKSLESLVAVHGILRAGAAYVPIDPLAPTDTMAAMVNDCGISTIVSHEPRRAGIERLCTDPGTGVALKTVIGIDGNPDSDADQDADNETERSIPGVGRTIGWGDVAGFDPANPASVAADDLAYVMYTSGSTGAPKGITHTHYSGMSYVEMSAELYGLGPEDRMANFAPLHFDQSTFEVLSGVAVGARVVLIPEPYLRFPASLAQYIAEQRCTTLYTVPSLFQQLLARGGLAEHDLSAVRWVLPGGEVFPPEPLAQLIALVPNAEFSNIYGPAEVNQCTYYHFDTVGQDETLPIGYQCPGAELLVVDGDDRPITAPSSEKGELLVRAKTMMAGYWKRPDLDRKAFVDLAGPDGASQRWYRTGDFVSWAEDVTQGEDCLLYHGRRDNQIKIRGNRVELELVETALCSLEGVEQAVVGIRPDAAGESVLVARYLADETAEPGLWRRSLAGQLPLYAVPATYEPVDDFPLTPSGKVDRRAVRQQISQPVAATSAEA